MNCKTNIIFILIDDMGWSDLGCYGSKYYETPNIDRMAEQGIVFDNAYAACPVCSPTRASILTGKYPARVKVTDWIGAHTRGKLIDADYVKYLPLEEKSLAKSLKEGGYSTWHVGKWHLGTKKYYPENHGFDVNIGGCHLGHPNNGYFSPYNIENLSDGLEGEYLTDRLTDESIKLIKNRDKNKPFFLNLWHYAVHTPIDAKEKDIEYFNKKAMGLGLDKMNPFIEGERFPCYHKKNERVLRRIIQSDASYGAMVFNLDLNIGRLVDVLKKEGILEDTIIFFTSDNGGLSSAEGSPTCNFPLSEGKGWMYEGGVREPLIVYWKDKIQSNLKSSKLVSSPDFYPTILDIAGLNKIHNQHVDGESFYKSLMKQYEVRDKPLFWHYPHYGNQGGTPYSSIRKENYKLIYFYESNTYKLFDLEKDISEDYDISNEKYEVCIELMNLLNQWIKDVGGETPKVNMEFIK